MSSNPERLARRLIVNADDFGLSVGVNAGIMEAREQGIVTSASLMVRAPAAAAAADYARSLAPLQFSVGMHVDLAEWYFQDGKWETLYEVVPVNDEAAVQEEVTRQWNRFLQLMGGRPTHLDSHQHLHRSEPLRSVLRKLAAAEGLPLRHFHPRIRYAGSFYGQGDRGIPHPEGIRVENLLNLLRELPAGVTEMACHPGRDSGLQSMYVAERAIEVATLCDCRVRHTLDEEAIQLVSFSGALE